MVNAPKTLFPDLLLVQMESWWIDPYNNVIKRVKPRWACKRTQSEHYVHCIAWDPKGHLGQREDKKPNLFGNIELKNGARMMSRDKLLREQCELSHLREQLSRRRKIWEVLKAGEWQKLRSDKRLSRFWMLSETVLVILPLQTMRTMGEMMKMPSRGICATMMNTVVWWTQCRKHHSTAWGVVSRTRSSLTNKQNRVGGMVPIPHLNEMWWTTPRTQKSWLSSNHIRTMMPQILHTQPLEILWTFWILSLESIEYRKGLLCQGVVRWG